MKILITAALLCLVFSVQADTVKYLHDQKFIAKGDIAKLCLAALESRHKMEQLAKDQGIKHRELKQITCNDMPVMRFARKHRGDLREWLAIRE